MDSAAGPEKESANGSLRQVLRHRQFRYLVGSFAVSWSGDWCYSVALTVWVAERTGSPAWLAVAAALRFLPYICFGTAGGALAARVDRRRLMVALDLVRAGLMAALALLVAVNGPVLLALVLAFLGGACSAVYRPAVVASTPRLVDDDDLASANALEGIVNQLCIFVGPVIGGVILSIGSPMWAFVFNAASFVVSALLVAQVTAASRAAVVPIDEAGHSADTEESEHASGVIQELVEGWRVIRSAPGLLAHTAMVCAFLFLFGAEMVVLVLVPERLLGSGAGGLSVLNACVGAGGLLLAPLTARLAGRRRLSGLFTWGVAVSGLAFAALGVVSDLAVAGLVMLAAGAGLMVFEVAGITLLQRAVRDDALARVYGLQDALGAAATLAGAFVVSILVGIISLSGTLVLLGGALVAVAIVGARGVAALDGDPAPAVELAV